MILPSFVPLLPWCQAKDPRSSSSNDQDDPAKKCPTHSSIEIIIPVRVDVQRVVGPGVGYSVRLSRLMLRCVLVVSSAVQTRVFESTVATVRLWVGDQKSPLNLQTDHLKYKLNGYCLLSEYVHSCNILSTVKPSTQAGSI